MAILGNNTAGGDTFPCSSDRAMLSPYTATEDGTVTEIHYTFDATSTAGTNMKGLIYTGSGSVPSGTPFAVGAAVAIPVNGGDVTSTVSCSITNGTKYWIGYVCDSSTAVADIETTGGSSRMEATSYASPGTWSEAGTSTEGCGWIVYTAGPPAEPNIPTMISNFTRQPQLRGPM